MYFISNKLLVKRGFKMFNKKLLFADRLDYRLSFIRNNFHSFCMVSMNLSSFWEEKKGSLYRVICFSKLFTIYFTASFLFNTFMININVHKLQQTVQNLAREKLYNFAQLKVSFLSHSRNSRPF